MKTNIIIMVCLVIFIGNLYSAGTSNGLFLKLPASAKGAGLGNANTSLADDINSVYFNPAGIGKIKSIQGTFMHCEYIGNIRYENFAAGLPIKEIKLDFLKDKNIEGNIGINLILLNSGEIVSTLKEGPSEYSLNGTTSTRDLAIGLSYGRTLDKINYGATLKILNSRLADVSATSVAFDLGLIYNIEDKTIPIKIGAIVQNIGPGLKYDKTSDLLPITSKIGASGVYNYKEMIDVTASLDLGKSKGSSYELNSGLEFGFYKSYFLRFGYSTLYDIGSGLSFGIGAIYKNLSIDYALSSMGDFGLTHKISLSFINSPPEPITVAILQPVKISTKNVPVVDPAPVIVSGSFEGSDRF